MRSPPGATAGNRGSLRHSALALVVLALAGCPSNANVVACPTGTSPCGNGCIPSANSVCCDDGTQHTSSYCTNAAGGGCFENTAQRCAAAFPAGAQASFCCSANGSFGSNDCPAGQHHCGLQCFPAGHSCCPAGASSADCPETSWDPTICPSPAPGTYGCAYCANSGMCIPCYTGTSCAGDPCIPNAVCALDGTSPPTGGSSGGSGGGGQCAHWSCGGSSQCAQVLGAPSGVQCQFAAGESCQQWCQMYVPGNCVCQ